MAGVGVQLGNQGILGQGALSGYGNGSNPLNGFTTQTAGGQPSGYYQQLLAQNPSLANNPQFVSSAGMQTQAQQAPTQQSPTGYSTSNNPTLADPNSVTGSAGQIGATAPAPIQDFGGIAQVAPTYAQAATVNPNQTQQYLNQYEQLTNQSLQPTFQQQQMQLQESDAARGIQNTGAAGYLQGNLLGQQGATLAAQYAPLVQQSYGYQQGDISQNQANQQAVNTGNASTANAAAGTNAGYYNNAVGANYNAYNDYLQQLQGEGANQQNALLSAYLNSFGANTGVSNVLSQGLSGTQNAYSNVFNTASNQASQDAGAAAAAFGA